MRKGTVELLIKVEDTIEIPIALTRPDNGCLGIGTLIEPFRYTLSARCAADSTLLGHQTGGPPGSYVQRPRVGLHHDEKPGAKIARTPYRDPQGTENSFYEPG